MTGTTEMETWRCCAMSPFPSFPSVRGQDGDERRAAAALHEAGHAVIAAFDGYSVASVRLKSKGAAYGGTIICSRPPWPSLLAEATAAARMAAAGYAAVMAFAPQWLEYEGNQDRVALGIHCRTIAGLLGSIDAFEVAHTIGRSVAVDLGLNEHRVVALAGALERRCTVQGQKLQRMLPASAEAATLSKAPTKSKAGCRQDSSKIVETPA